MEKAAEFPAHHTSESTAGERAHERRLTGRRRSGLSREELRSELLQVRRQRRTLAISLVLLFVTCGAVTVWALNTQSALSALEARNRAQASELSNLLAATTTELEETRRRVDTLVAARIPGLLPFHIGEPLVVDAPFVREVSFKAPELLETRHEVKLVVENDSSDIVRPRMSVILFDDVGIQVARAELMDGARDALRADEIRSFFAKLEVAAGATPSYFLVTSD